MSEHFSVAKDAIEGAVSVLSHVPTRSGIISSEFIRFERTGSDKIRLALSSDVSSYVTIKGSGKVPFDKEVFLDRRMVLPFVDAGKDMTADLYKMKLTDEKHISLSHGMRTAIFRSNSKASGYQSPPKLSELSFPLDSSWISLVGCAKTSATDDPISPNMNCVYLRKNSKHLEVMSTNGKLVFRGILEDGKVGAPVEPIAFPLALIDALSAENSGTLKWDKKVALLEFPTGKVWQSVKSEARRNFPHQLVTDLINKSKAKHALLTLGTDALADSAGRIAAYLSSVTREDLVLTMKIDKGKNVLHFKSGVSGSNFDEVVKLSSAAKDDIEIEWPLDAVRPILEYCKGIGEAKIYKDDKGRSCFSSGSVSVLIGKRSKKK